MKIFCLIEDIEINLQIKMSNQTLLKVKNVFNELSYEPVLDSDSAVNVFYCNQVFILRIYASNLQILGLDRVTQ